MKIEILKCAKGNDQKQNKPAKAPKPRIPKAQVGPHAKRNKKQRKRKLPKDWRKNPAKHETAPKFYLFLFQIVKKYRSWKKLQQDRIHLLGRRDWKIYLSYDNWALSI